MTCARYLVCAHVWLTQIKTDLFGVGMSRVAPRKLHFPMEKVIVTVNEHGNTSAASVPLALDVAARDGRIKPRDLLMLEAFGGGLTWRSALIRFKV